MIRLLLLFALPCAGTELRIQVFQLFDFASVEVTASSVRLGGRVLPDKVGVAARGGQVCHGAICGEVLQTSGGRVQLAIERLSRRFSGDAEIRASKGKLTAVVRMDLENAVAAVVAAEMPHVPQEAQRAQAVAARSYYLASGRRHAEADFCDTTHCQFLTVASAASREAAASTRGRILRYRGEPVAAMYFRSCGGRTFTGQEVQLAGAGFPFVTVECSVCRRDPVRWRLELDGEDAAKVLEHPHAEAVRLEVARRIGWNRFPSNDYTVEGGPDKVVLHGKGHGHGLGLCQRGAVAMAGEGHRFDDILIHYFPGAALRD